MLSVTLWIHEPNAWMLTALVQSPSSSFAFPLRWLSSEFLSPTILDQPVSLDTSCSCTALPSYSGKRGEFRVYLSCRVSIRSHLWQLQLLHCQFVRERMSRVFGNWIQPPLTSEAKELFYYDVFDWRHACLLRLLRVRVRYRVSDISLSSSDVLLRPFKPYLPLRSWFSLSFCQGNSFLEDLWV